MNPKIIFPIITLTVLLGGSACAAMSTLDYGTHEISITIQPGQEATFLIPLEVGDHLRVDLIVTDGGPVDFYLTNLTAYNVYRASVAGTLNFPSLYYVADYSRENGDFIHYSYDSYVANELVVLIDNTGNTQNGAAPLGPVSITGTIVVEQNVWTPVNITITLIVVVLIIAFMVGFWFRKKKP